MVLRQVSVLQEYSYGEVQTIEFNVLVKPFKVIYNGDAKSLKQKKKIIEEKNKLKSRSFFLIVFKNKVKKMP
jgi:hypothetical protein